MSRQLLRPDSALLALALVCVHLRLLLLGSKAALQLMVVSFVVTQVLNQLQKVPSLAGIQSSPFMRLPPFPHKPLILCLEV